MSLNFAPLSAKTSAGSGTQQQQQPQTKGTSKSFAQQKQSHPQSQAFESDADGKQESSIDGDVRSAQRELGGILSAFFTVSSARTERIEADIAASSKVRAQQKDTIAAAVTSKDENKNKLALFAAISHMCGYLKLSETDIWIDGKDTLRRKGLSSLGDVEKSDEFERAWPQFVDSRLSSQINTALVWIRTNCGTNPYAANIALLDIINDISGLVHFTHLIAVQMSDSSATLSGKWMRQREYNEHDSVRESLRQYFIATYRPATLH